MTIEEKLNRLTTIPATNFENLFNLIDEVCCDDIINCISNGEKVACVDIGIGQLSFLIEDDSIEYKFIPNYNLETMVVKSVKSGKSPLVEHLNRGITEKIMEAYKNLM